MFSDFLAGFATAVTPENLLFVLIGVLIGMLVGVLPGIGPVATIALLLPFTLNLDAATAVMMLAGVYYGAMYGGTITSVMLKVPGEAATLITLIDGYPMAKQGRAASALGISAIGSLIGGVVAVVGMVLLAPQMADFALHLGPMGITAFALVGLILVSTVSSGSTPRSLAMAFVGVALATVGLDSINGAARMTFGVSQLYDGLDIAVVAVGLLGVGELVDQLVKRESALATTEKIKSVVLPTRADMRESTGAIGRGSVIGFLLGLVPGGGGMLASLASYGVERRISKHPERFGHGAIQGVAGPETANNAAAQSAFVPLLTLGLPTNPVLALVFGALLLQGISPGPSLITEHADVFWGVVASMLIGNVFLVVVNVFMIRFWIRIARIPIHFLAPVAIAVILVSVYSVSYSMFDVFLALGFGLVGYVLEKLNLSAAPLVMGFVLGQILEANLLRSLAIGDGSLGVFVTDPIAAPTLGFAALLLAASAWGAYRTMTGHKRRDAAHAILGQPDDVEIRFDDTD